MKYEILKLKNGMKIIVCFCPNFSSVYFDFAIKTGSVFENSKNNGLAHFVEHLVSKKVISNKKEKDQWLKKYIIHNFRGYTLQDRINFELVAHKKDLKTAFNILVKILKPLKITFQEMATEKEIILDEFLAYQDNPYFLFDRFVKQNYYKNNSLRFDALGTKNNIKKFNSLDVKNFINKYFIGENIILTIAGDVSIKEIKNQINNRLSFLNKKNYNKLDELKKFSYQGNSFNFKEYDCQQDYFGYYYPIFNKSAEDNVKWEFFIEILNNYLFYNLTKKVGCYFVDTNVRIFKEFINFSIESSFDPSKTVAFYLNLQKEIISFKKNFNSNSFEQFKHEKIISLDLELDYPKEHSNMIAWYALMFGSDKILTISDQQEIIKSTKFKDIKIFFAQLFEDKKGSVFVMGNKAKNKEKKLYLIWQKWQV